MASNTYLFVWNPSKWPFSELNQKKQELESLARTKILWSVSAHKQVKIGDRAFICRVGVEPKGIFASGVIASEPRLAPHWSGTKLVQRLFLELDILLNPDVTEILSLDILNEKVSSSQCWTPQSSGIRISNEPEKLEEVWFEFILNQKLDIINIDEHQVFVEGRPFQITQTLYERNPHARKICLKYHGYSCSACKFNFKSTFGTIGNEYIHVHHLTPLSAVSDNYKLNPIHDLIPVCPNCHAMLHRRNPPYSIEELKSIVSNIKNP